MRVAALAGGVGGAKLAHGLALHLGAGELSVVVNTADDFDLWGLRICPDLDTVLYTLAGVANRELGWGVEGETWGALGMLGAYGEDTWFRVGDRDLATHVLRTHLLRNGWTLTRVAARLSGELGVEARLLPMCDEPVATLVETPEGELEFQEYFVRRRHEPAVTGVRFRGVAQARPTPAVIEALMAADLIVFCPSNPFVSIGPILAVPGMADALRRAAAPTVAVSPIVGGLALKGPADRMLRSLGHEASALGVARLYQGMVDGIVIDQGDAHDAPAIRELGMAVLAADTVMRDDGHRRALARATVEWGRSLAAVGAVAG